MKAYENIVANEKYLKLNDQGEFMIDCDEDLNIIDFHIHLSHVFPGKENDPHKIGPQLKYPTLASEQSLDLTIPYWTNVEFLNKKYGRWYSICEFVIEGISIFNDMVKGGTYNNCFTSFENNMISKAVVLPISSAKTDRSMKAINSSKEYPNQLIPFCSIHPNDKNIKHKLYHYKALGAKGLKLKISDLELKGSYDKLLELMMLCYKADMPVIFHTGTVYSPENMVIKGMMSKLLQSTRMEIFGNLLKKLPNDFIMIFAHSGIQEYKLVAEYMKQYPAVYAELSSQSEDSIRYLINEVGSERLLYGSDWPALPQSITLSRVLLATEGDKNARDNILYKNAMKILKC